jgi:hypothetical protein
MVRRLSVFPLLFLPFLAMAAEENTKRLQASTDVLVEIGDKVIPGGLFSKSHAPW